MSSHPRVRCTALHGKIMSAEEAAALIVPGDNVGMSGFTGSGYDEGVGAHSGLEIAHRG